MLSRNDIILFTTAICACIGGYFLPEAAPIAGKLPPIGLILMMILSFLSIPISVVVTALRERKRTVFLLTGTKMILLPLAGSFICEQFWPEYTIVMLLMAGICSGSSCPYFGLLLKGDTPLLVVLVFTTSLLAPISLPLLVKLIVGTELSISVWSLALSLSLYVLLPMILAELLRRFLRPVTEFCIQYRSPVNILLFAIINFGIFSVNSEMIAASIDKVLISFLFACFAAIFFLIVGFLSGLPLDNSARTSSMVSFSMTNNILVIVLCGSYFGDVELLTAAMYTIPFFLVLTPIRFLSTHFSSY